MLKILEVMNRPIHNFIHFIQLVYVVSMDATTFLYWDKINNSVSPFIFCPQIISSGDTASALKLFLA
jgi:hypothetical protein